MVLPFACNVYFILWCNLWNVGLMLWRCQDKSLYVCGLYTSRVSFRALVKISWAGLHTTRVFIFVVRYDCRISHTNNHYKSPIFYRVVQKWWTDFWDSLIIIRDSVSDPNLRLVFLANYTSELFRYRLIFGVIYILSLLFMAMWIRR